MTPPHENIEALKQAMETQAAHTRGFDDALRSIEIRMANGETVSRTEIRELRTAAAACARMWNVRRKRASEILGTVPSKKSWTSP